MKRLFKVFFSTESVDENNNIKWLDSSVCDDFCNHTGIYPIDYVEVETIEDDEDVDEDYDCRAYTLPMDLYSEEYLNDLAGEELEQWMKNNKQYLTYSSCENDNKLYALFMAFPYEGGERLFAFVCNQEDSFDNEDWFAEQTVEHLGLEVDWDDLMLFKVCFGGEDEEMKYDNYLKFNRIDEDDQIYYENQDQRVYLTDEIEI